MSRTTLDAKSYADAMWRAGFKCERCEGTMCLEVHHVVGRQPPVLVNEPDNLLVLCVHCHAWWHGQKQVAVGWFIGRFGRERYDHLLGLRAGRKGVRVRSLAP